MTNLVVSVASMGLCDRLRGVVPCVVFVPCLVPSLCVGYGRLAQGRVFEGRLRVGLGNGSTSSCTYGLRSSVGVASVVVGAKVYIALAMTCTCVAVTTGSTFDAVAVTKVQGLVGIQPVVVAANVGVVTHRGRSTVAVLPAKVGVVTRLAGRPCY